MRREEFQAQANRLKARWPGNTFADEFLAILWREVEPFSGVWFQRVVDKFIGECRQAPLMPEFRTEISQERERNWATQKRQHSEEAQGFYYIANDPDFRGQVIRTITDRMHGRVTDETWTQFVTGLDRLVRGQA